MAYEAASDATASARTINSLANGNVPTTLAPKRNLLD
jgi:hypothetical protein